MVARKYARVAAASLGVFGMLGAGTTSPIMEILHVFSSLPPATRDSGASRSRAAWSGVCA